MRPSVSMRNWLEFWRYIGLGNDIEREIYYSEYEVPCQANYKYYIKTCANFEYEGRVYTGKS